MRFISLLAGFILPAVLCTHTLSLQADQIRAPVPVLNPKTPIEHFVLESWNIRDDLPSNGITALTQIRDGYLWLGTRGGLVRFDGNSFKLFNDANDDAFADSSIHHLFGDSLGQLWIVTFGRNLIIYRNGDFERIATPPDFVGIESLFERPDGRVWISSQHAIWETRIDEPLMLNEVHTNKPVWVKIQPGENQPVEDLDKKTIARLSQTLGSTDQAVLEVREDDSGHFWVGIQDLHIPNTLDLLRFSPQGDRIEWRSSEAGMGRIASVHLDAANSLWIAATGQSLARYARDELQVLTLDEGLPGEFVYALESDAEGHLWFGTLKNGLGRLKNTSVTTLSSEEGLPGTDVRALIETDDGTRWVGLRNSGLVQLSGQSTKRITTADGLVDNRVFSMFQSSDGVIWVGTSTGISRIGSESIQSWSGDNEFPSSMVRSITSDGRGVLWFGTADGLVVFRNGTFNLVRELVGQPLGIVVNLFLDRQERLWIGTAENGLFIHSFNETLHFSKRETGVHVQGFLQLENEDVWMTTRGSGIFRYRDKKLNNIRRKNGLADDVGGAMLADGYGNLWLGSNRGVSRISIAATERWFNGELEVLESRRFTASDGMRSVEVAASSGPGAMRVANGELWFATAEGVAIFNPATVDDEPLPPTVIIESITADNIDLPINNIVPAGTRNLEIHYTSTSLIDGKRNTFRYQLLGNDEQPVDAGTRRAAYYNNLKPGEYEFWVSAANARGVWNSEGVRFKFKVEAFFYQTQSFLAALILLLIAMSIWAYQWRIRKMKFTQLALEKEVTARTSEISLQRDQIGEQADRLRLLDEAKSRFFANVTHEIRTPLTTMMGPLEDWLADHENTQASDISGPVKRALDSSKRLYQLVNQLMSFARIESGETRLNRRRDDLVVWLEQAWSGFIPPAKSCGVEYLLRGPEQELFVEFDEEQMQFVVSNLISNAIKFTPQGGTIVVEICARQRGPRAELELRVSDTGCGIADEHLELVFERFFQASETHISGQAGTGIGLSLAQEIVELHGGRIMLESVLGQGSVFTVVLPIHTLDKDTISINLQYFDFRNTRQVASAPDDLPEPGGNDLQNEWQKDRYTILVIDDNEDVRQYVIDGLARDYLVLQAESGNSGYQLAREQQPDLIVCDIMMPDGTGLDLLHKLRTDPDVIATPVILLTAKAEAQDTLDGLSAGANDYITKPFSMKELRARIRSQIDSQLRLFNELRLTQLKKRAVSISAVRDTKDSDFLSKLEAYILTRLSETSLSAEDIASELYMSRAAFFRKLRKLADQTPGEVIRKIRLDEAKRLIEEGTGNVGEVAYAVGFNSRTYFSRCFKQQFKQAPGELAMKYSHQKAN